MYLPEIAYVRFSTLWFVYVMLLYFFFGVSIISY